MPNSTAEASAASTPPCIARDTGRLPVIPTACADYAAHTLHQAACASGFGCSPAAAGEAGAGGGMTCDGASRSSVTQDPGYDESMVKLNP